MGKKQRIMGKKQGVWAMGKMAINSMKISAS